MKSIKKLFVILIVSVFMISMVATVSAASGVSEKKDTGVTIDSKSKTICCKITWNANGGKIGTKKIVTTSVTKGSKIKMVATPKRSGYKFLGWYTQKTAGNQITADTKPTKSVTYFAHWKKNHKIVGTWKDNSNIFTFTNTGKFKYTQINGSKTVVTQGNYKISDKNISFSKIVTNPGKTNEQAKNNTVFEYKFVKDSGGEYLMIPTVFNDLSYVDISYGTGLRK